MLKFTADGKNGTMFFLGLSRGNIDRLVSGQPVKVNLSDMGGPAVDVVILFGETEKILFNDLKKAGLLSEEFEYSEPEPGVVKMTRVRREQ